MLLRAGVLWWWPILLGRTGVLASHARLCLCWWVGDVPQWWCWVYLPPIPLSYEGGAQRPERLTTLGRRAVGCMCVGVGQGVCGYTVVLVYV